jgi:hypothetical protein
MDLPVAESSQRARRAQVTPSAVIFNAVDSVADAFRRRPSGARRASTPWYHWVTRLGTIAGVAVTTVAVAAFAVPATTASTPEVTPTIVVTPTPAAAKTVLAGTLANPVSKQVQNALMPQQRMYATAALTIRAEASSEAEALGSLTFGQAVVATSEVEGDYRLVQADDVEGWVLDENLIKENEELEGGISMQPCDRGSKIEAKLRSDTIKIYRSVCALFPGINSYGGWRAGGRSFHKNGRALDMMLTPKKESKLGWQIAAYLVSHYKEFNIDHIIFEQKIWTPSNQRWRKMADRGSTTANHYDHVHVAIKA